MCLAQKFVSLAKNKIVTQWCKLFDSHSDSMRHHLAARLIRPHFSYRQWQRVIALVDLLLDPVESASTNIFAQSTQHTCPLQHTCTHTWDTHNFDYTMTSLWCLAPTLLFSLATSSLMLWYFVTVNFFCSDTLLPPALLFSCSIKQQHCFASQFIDFNNRTVSIQ